MGRDVIEMMQARMGDELNPGERYLGAHAMTIKARKAFGLWADGVDLSAVLPSYVAEGRSHFSVAFGCTGGQHRSVYLAERLAEALAQAGWRVSIRHREIERRAARGRGQPKPDNGVSGA